MIVLGVDPGFRSLGYALLDVGPTSERVAAMGVLRTAPSAKKQHVLSTEDNVRRARELAGALRALVSRAGAICAESMSFPRSSSAAAKMALSWGLLVQAADTAGIAILQASPQTVKLAVAGAKSASKEEVEDALERRYGSLLALLDGIPRGQFEHAYDALAAAVTCLDSEAIRLARRVAA